MPGPIKVVYVASDEGTANRVLAALDAESDQFLVEATTEPSRGLERLADGDVDCVVSDYDLPGTDGVELLERAHQQDRTLPAVLCTDEGNDSIVNEAVATGVSEYVLRGSGSDWEGTLATRIRSAVRRHQSRRGVVGTASRCEELATVTDNVLWMFTHDWEELLLVNGAYEAIWGRPVDRLKEDPTDFLTGVHPEDRSRVREAMQTVSDGDPVELEFRVNADEEFGRWVQVQAEPIVDGGDITRVAGVARDVTELKEHEQKRRESELRYRRLVESSPGPVCIYTADGEMVYANDAAATFLGTDSPDELLGTTAGEFTHPESRPDVEKRRRRLTEDREPVPPLEEKLVDSDGQTKHAIVASTPVTWEGEPAIQTVLTDITERRERERQLSGERNRFMTLFEHLPNPVVHGEMVDGEPIIKQVNPAFEETFGYDVDEAVGHNLDDLTVPESKREEARRINERIATEDSIRIEVERHTSDGLREFVVDMVLADSDEDDATHEGYAIYTDITDQKARTRELRRKNERLDEFAGLVSHDLRNPLNTLQMSLELVESDEEALERCRRAVDRMKRLIEDLLRLARQGEAIETRQQVELAAAVGEAWRTVATEEAVLDVETDLTLSADRGRLKQLLENLIRNSVEHAGPGARVTVGDAGDGFYVADDGPGIPSDVRDEVFEAGYSTASDGTGFGLAIVREITEAHGWQVRLAERPDGGAKFVFTGIERSG